MDVTLQIMLACLAVGLIVAVVGMVRLGTSVYRMYKLVVAVQAELQAQVESLVAKQDEILVRLDSIQANQEQLALNLEQLRVAYGRLGFIVGELGDAAAVLKPVEPLAFFNGKWAEALSVLRRV